MDAREAHGEATLSPQGGSGEVLEGGGCPAADACSASAVGGPAAPPPRPPTHAPQQLALEAQGEQRHRLHAGSKGSKSLEIVTAMFVDRTSDGVLLKRLREVEDRLSNLTKYRVKIVEKNGLTLSQTLIQRDPYRGWGCCRECGVCMWKPDQNKEENCN